MRLPRRMLIIAFTVLAVEALVFVGAGVAIGYAVFG